MHKRNFTNINITGLTESASVMALALQLFHAMLFLNVLFATLVIIFSASNEVIQARIIRNVLLVSSYSRYQMLL
ncbi:Hypothetical predicted protein [Octopus vulgaris]|uniref:Uncharacterized protein n=1 Tax=Octopus vulgaris TaxID=6645 RepID=A0AA36AG45_OCTVU|nr:Hypothetical predicted protein [Octopus vulgaris]